MNESHWIFGLMQEAYDEAAAALPPAEVTAALEDWDNHPVAGEVFAQAVISTMPIRMRWLR